jgi:serine/threonine-protein kinase
VDEVVNRLSSALEGHYSVKEEIGQGGMAVVYLAEDLKHHRKVALKVLRAELAAIIGAERFLKEIEVTANLQHPNILPLYDSGNADGFLYYVMPLLEGETLRAKLDREHQLGVDEAVEIAKAVAAAVDYAHRHGVIHRDLKPSNILLHDGQALVSDFGIALALRKGAAETRLTETGLSVGTPHYMSPEQAAGDRELDARSDLYSLGALTYEMLVGEPPHVAKTAQAVVAKILSDTPAPIRRTRELVPANVEAAVAKALARSPADRFTSLAEFAAALANPGFTLPTMVAAGGGMGDGQAGLWKRWGPVAAGVAVVAIILCAWGWLRTEEPSEVARYNLAFLPDQELVDVVAQTFEVAEGGKAMVYLGPGEEGNQLWVKRQDEIGATPLPGTTGASYPSISPDGDEVAFISSGELRKMPVTGGAAITLTDSAVLQAAWMDDGRLVYMSAGDFRLMAIPSAGGDPVRLWPDQPDSVGTPYPAPLPGSHGMVFTYCEGSSCATRMGIWALNVRTGEAHELVPGGVRAWYLESGHLVFVRPDGAVFAAPFDVDALELTGAAVPVLEEVKVQSSLYPDMALTPDGTLLYLVAAGAAQGPDRELVWVSREGVVRQVDPSWRFSTSRNRGWTLSPDGTRLAIGLTTEEGDDVWIKELDDGPLVRLTYDPAEDAIPRWSRDGGSVYFVSRRREGARADLYVQRADGAGDPLPVLVRDAQIWQPAFSPDGEWLVARVGGTTGQTGARNIVAYRLEGDTAEVPLMTSDYDEVSPTFSPDGRWLAYASQETGNWEVYARPFPEVASGKWPVSRGGGSSPVWSHSGREIFYISPDSAMMVAAVEAGETFRVADRRRLFTLPDGFNITQINVLYDVTPDDQRFIGVRDVSAAMNVVYPLILVENWTGEILERVRQGGG